MKRKIFTGVIIIIIALVVCLITFSPLINSGKPGLFFSVDPDVMYTANSFLFLKSGNIYYFDQPGTPAIILMSAGLFLFNVYVKIFHNSSFVLYSLNNFGVIFFYLRMVQVLILFASLVIAFFSLFKLTRSQISIYILSSILLLFTPFYYLGVTISAETVSFLFVSLWLMMIVYVLKNNSKKGVFLIFLIAGLAFASRATTFFLIPSSFIFLPVLRKNKIIDNFVILLKYTAVVVCGFVVGIFPLFSKIKEVLAVIFSFASSTEIHGGGSNIIFDWAPYYSSIRQLLGSNYEFAAIVAIAGIAFIFGVFAKDEIVKKISYIGLIFCFGVAVFAKFPLSHYQTFNYYSIAFLVTFLIINVCKRFSFVVPLVLLVFFIPSAVKGYFVSIAPALNQSKIFDKYVRENARQSVNIWQWARSKDFAILWTRDYAPPVFDTSMTKLKYPIYELTGDYKIKISASKEVNLFGMCWDNLFVQKSSIQDLIDKYPVILKMKIIDIKETPLDVIQSQDCIKNI